MDRVDHFGLSKMLKLWSEGRTFNAQTTDNTFNNQRVDVQLHFYVCQVVRNVAETNVVTLLIVDEEDNLPCWGDLKSQNTYSFDEIMTENKYISQHTV